MSDWSNYRADGDEYTRVAPMKYDPTTKTWVVDTTSIGANYLDLAFYNPYSIDPVDADERIERFDEVAVIDDPRINGEVYKRSAGFRYYLKLQWKAIRTEDRAVTVNISNNGVGKRYRVWPHRDVTGVYYDCILTASDVMATHEVNGFRSPCHSAMLEFKGAELTEVIPHNWTSYHYFFSSKGSFGAFTGNEKLRLCFFRDKSSWSTYALTDLSGQFSTKNLKKLNP